MMTTTETDSIVSSPTSTTELHSIADHASKMTSADKMSYRKTTKPMMEKKRRARINHCLSQLKSLVLQAMKKDNSQYSKLEKADILELTVKHLKHVQRIQASTNTSNSQIPAEAFSKYRAGFNECANEVIRYLGETQGLNNDARTRILSHLSSILSPVNSLPLQPTSTAQILSNPAQMLQGHTPILPAPVPSHQQQHQNVNLQLHDGNNNKNILNPLSLLHQQQRGISQESHHIYKASTLIQNELQQRQTQQQNKQHQEQQNNILSTAALISAHHRQNSIPSLSVPDLNNNSVTIMNNNNNNVDGVVNRNIANTTSAAVNSYGSHSISSSLNLNNSASSIGNTEHTSNLISSTPANQDLKLLSASSSLDPPSSFPLHSIASSASMTTSSPSPFQLVQSTLPNGQIALVLAPTPTHQILPAINVYPTHPSTLISRDMATISAKESQSQSSVLSLNQEKSPSTSQSESGLQEHRDIISPRLLNNNNNQYHNLCQETPLPLVVSKTTTQRLNLNNSLSTLNSIINDDQFKTKISAFRHPVASPLITNSSSLSSSSIDHSSLSSSSIVHSGVNYDNANAKVFFKQDQNLQHQELHNSRSISPTSPPKIKYLSINDNEISGDGGARAKIRDHVRSPEEVTSRKDMLEYKMSKSRSQSRTQNSSTTKGQIRNDAKNTWRPW